MKKILISIINYKSEECTLDCLKSLNDVEFNNIDVSVLVIDSGSTGKLKVKDKFKFPLKVIESKENLGFSGGHNLSFRFALSDNYDYVLVLNNDTVLDKKFLAELYNVAEKEDLNGMVVPKIYFAKGCEFHKDKYRKEDLGKVFWYAGGEMDWANIIGKNRGVDQVDKGQFDKTEETDLITGCCVLIKRNSLKNVGCFDDNYFLYYEDNDLCQRFKRGGYRILYAPKSIIWHKNAGSGGGSGSVLQDYYITRNRLYFAMKYAPLRSKIALIRESIRLLVTGREWQKVAVRDFYRKKFGKGTYGERFL